MITPEQRNMLLADIPKDQYSIDVDNRITFLSMKANCEFDKKLRAWMREMDGDKATPVQQNNGTLVPKHDWEYYEQFRNGAEKVVSYGDAGERRRN